MSKKDVAKLGKAELVTRVKENLQMISDANEGGKVTNADAENAFDAVIAAVVDAIAEGNHVGVQGLGVFELRERSARTAPNPYAVKQGKKGATVKVPAHTGLGFKPASGLKEAVKAI